MHGQRLDVVGLDGREHADAQLVAAELAVAVGVDDAVGPQTARDLRGVDPVVEVDRADDGGLAWPARRRTASPRSSPRPSRTGLGRGSARSTHHVSPPLSSIHCSCWSSRNSVARPACCRSGRAGCCRGRSRGRAMPGVHRSDAAIARCARRRPASRPPATGRRRRRSTSGGEVVDVDLGRVHGSPPAADVASTTTSAGRPRRPAGAPSPRRSRSRCGSARRRRRRRRRRLGWCPARGDDERLVEVGAPLRVGELRTRTRRTRGAGCAARSGRTWRRPRTTSCRRCRGRPPSRRAGRTAR